MEQLFGSSDISYRRQVITPRFSPLNERSPAVSLLVLLGEQTVDLQENQLLNRMLKTLELPAEDFVISDLKQYGADELIKKHRPKCIFTMGQVSKRFGIMDFSVVFSSKYNEIPVVSTHSPGHLLNYSEDKRHSWQCLLLIKSLLKS